MNREWRAAERVLEVHGPSLIAVPGVRGTAIGACDGRPCIRVFVADESVLELGGIPGTLDGVPVKIEVSGRFDARSS